MKNKLLLILLFSPLCSEEWAKQLSQYLEAYQQDPKCGDPLAEIATHYRFHGKNDLAYIFAKHGSELKVEKVPKYQFHYELAICAYYTPFRDEGFAHANALVLQRDVAWWVKNQVYCLMRYYDTALKNARYMAISPQIPPLYSPMNPSIQRTDKGYEVICRAVNYTTIGAMSFPVREADNIIRTKNYLLQYDRNFNLLSQKEIVERLPRERIYTSYASSHVQGQEDCRFFHWNDNIWFTCSMYGTDFSGVPKIVLCALGEPKDDLIDVKKLTALKGPEPGRCEKNWLPFVKDGSLYAIYSWDPFILYQPDPETGECKTVLQYSQENNDLSFMRGSAGPVPFEDGYLALVHEYAFDPSFGRIYYQRFIQLDQNFKVKSMSLPFTFRHHGVEYCNSMTLDHSGKELIIAVGIEDHEAYLCFVDLETVRLLLKPIFTNKEGVAKPLS